MELVMKADWSLTTANCRLGLILSIWRSAFFTDSATRTVLVPLCRSPDNHRVLTIVASDSFGFSGGNADLARSDR